MSQRCRRCFRIQKCGIEVVQSWTPTKIKIVLTMFTSVLTIFETDCWVLPLLNLLHKLFIIDVKINLAVFDEVIQVWEWTFIAGGKQMTVYQSCLRVSLSFAVEVLQAWDVIETIFWKPSKKKRYQRKISCVFFTQRFRLFSKIEILESTFEPDEEKVKFKTYKLACKFSTYSHTSKLQFQWRQTVTQKPRKALLPNFEIKKLMLKRLLNIFQAQSLNVLFKKGSIFQKKC